MCILEKKEGKLWPVPKKYSDLETISLTPRGQAEGYELSEKQETVLQNCGDKDMGT